MKASRLHLIAELRHETKLRDTIAPRIPMQLKAKQVWVIRNWFRTVLAVPLIIATCGLLHAEEGTSAQRKACTPDVFRFCKVFIPNRSEITNCLQRNKLRLHADCRVIFDAKSK